MCAVRWRGGTTWAVVLLHCHVAVLGALNCLQSVPAPEPEWLELTSTPNSRQLPALTDSRLGYGDWPEDASGSPQKASYEAGWLNLSCPGGWVTRYKLYQGTLYTNLPEDKGDFMRSYFEEQLLIAHWLYKGLPDNIDIVMNGNDQLGQCEAALPVMQYTIFNTTSQVTGAPLNITPGRLAWPLKGHERHGVPYTHGYSMPFRETWRDLSLSPGQLKSYMKCVQDRHGGGVPTTCQAQPQLPQATDTWAAARKPKLVWRGSTTGFRRGWADHVVSSDPHSTHPLGKVLWNKRFYLCLLSRPYPFLDVAIGHKKGVVQKLSEACDKAITEMFQKPYISLEEQSSYQLVLSIDGHVGPWRYPQQMLGLSPIVRVDSPYREFFHKWLEPGVHYEPVQLDLSDYVATVSRLLAEAAVNSTRLQCMATAAAQVMLDHMHALAQLDSFVWSLMKINAAYDWEVRAPEEEPGIAWRPCRIGNRWISQGLLHIKPLVRKAYPENFRTLPRS